MAKKSNAFDELLATEIYEVLKDNLSINDLLRYTGFSLDGERPRSPAQMSYEKSLAGRIAKLEADMAKLQASIKSKKDKDKKKP